MICIWKNMIVFFLFAASCSMANAQTMDMPQSYNKKAKTKSASVWRCEIDYPPLTTKSGLRSQIFFLILYLDGTYEQQVFLVPEDKEAYKGIRYYELRGKWSSNDKEITLDENGKLEKILNTDFYSKFENVDNIIVNPDY